MGKSNIDSVTRNALWESYNRICFYCNRALNWNEIHIDHIIPDSLNDHPEKLRKLINEWNLISGFDLNSLQNLVPTHNKCNQRKVNELFSKQTTLFYLELAKARLNRVEKEISKIKRINKKNHILSKLNTAIETKVLSIKDLKSIIKQISDRNSDLQEITLPDSIDFLDEVYKTFNLNNDYSSLYEKPLLINGLTDTLYLMNEDHEIICVSTLREWQSATKNGYYPSDTISIKASSAFIFLEGFLDALNGYNKPLESFIASPRIELNNIDFLSPKIIEDFDGQMKEFAKEGLSIGDLYRKNIVQVRSAKAYEVVIEFETMETYLIEQFRGDFNADGIEDIFVRGWTRATQGTMGFGFTIYLTKYSSQDLILPFDEI